MVEWGQLRLKATAAVLSNSDDGNFSSRPGAGQIFVRGGALKLPLPFRVFRVFRGSSCLA
jgi:hypothetical protein